MYQTTQSGLEYYMVDGIATLLIAIVLGFLLNQVYTAGTHSFRVLDDMRSKKFVVLFLVGITLTMPIITGYGKRILVMYLYNTSVMIGTLGTTLVGLWWYVNHQVDRWKFNDGSGLAMLLVGGGVGLVLLSVFVL